MSTTAPTRQVITFKPDGTIEGLQFKGKGVDLRKFGRAKIERTSDIIFNEDSQKYSIKFLHGTLAGQPATFAQAADFNVPITEGIDCFGFPPGERDQILLFNEYDEAVTAEVLLIQSARLNGMGNMIAPH